jgi:aflatoxin B1 aldehyde reductase
VYYLHAPDPRVPLEEILDGVNELYKSGAFKRFGLSNFTGKEIEQVVSLAKEKGYVVPSVYQGNYNPFARRTETEVLPILRKYNFAFYAYSPSAGGFLTKTSDKIRNGGTGRWDPESRLGKLYNALYAGVSTAELAYRWVAHHSKLQREFGDAVIVGAQNPEHLRETVAWIKNGALDTEVTKKIDAIWDGIAADAPLDNYNEFVNKAGS